MVIQAMYILSNNSAGEPVKLGQFKLPLRDICLIQFHKLHLPVPQNTLKKWALENDWNGIHQNNINVKECPISIVTSDKKITHFDQISVCVISENFLLWHTSFHFLYSSMGFHYRL